MTKRVTLAQEIQQVEKPSVLQWFKEMREKNLENLPTLSGELGAMFREGIRDIRSTIHEAMWGTPEKVPEPGSPLSPTPQITTAALLGKDVDIER